MLRATQRNDDTYTTEAQHDVGTQTETSFQDVVRRSRPVTSDVHPLSVFPDNESTQTEMIRDVVRRSRPVISDFRPPSMFRYDEPTPLAVGPRFINRQNRQSIYPLN